MSENEKKRQPSKATKFISLVLISTSLVVGCATYRSPEDEEDRRDREEERRVGTRPQQTNTDDYWYYDTGSRSYGSGRSGNGPVPIFIPTPSGGGGGYSGGGYTGGGGGGGGRPSASIGSSRGGFGGIGGGSAGS